jgi:hypothetical protein
VQVGVPPAVGSDYGHFKVLGGGVLVRLTRGVKIQALALLRGPEYADQAVTRRSRGVCWG